MNGKERHSCPSQVREVSPSLGPRERERGENIDLKQELGGGRQGVGAKSGRETGERRKEWGLG